MYINGTDNAVPIGLGLALAQRSEALTHFAGLPENKKQEIIQRTHSIGSKKEMRSFVDNLSKSWGIM
jgi:hypothetical protein